MIIFDFYSFYKRWLFYKPNSAFYYQVSVFETTKKKAKISVKLKTLKTQLSKTLISITLGLKLIKLNLKY